MIITNINILGPEIQERLFEGQTAFDCPAVVVPVFKARLKALMNNIKEGKYFPAIHKTKYLIHVIGTLTCAYYTYVF